jgi:hypothetical protein
LRTRHRHPGLAALIIVIGIVLLLPGICSLIFIATFFAEDPSGFFTEGGLLLLWLFCFAIAAGGILLIRRAWAGRPV